MLYGDVCVLAAVVMPCISVCHAVVTPCSLAVCAMEYVAVRTFTLQEEGAKYGFWVRAWQLKLDAVWYRVYKYSARTVRVRDKRRKLSIRDERDMLVLLRLCFANNE
jgi:hypothetical protein